MRWSRKEKIILIGQLEIYSRADLSLAHAVDAIAEAVGKRRARSLGRIKNLIEGGKSLSGSLKSEVELSSAIIGLIECGEDSGSLAQALTSCRALLEREDELVKRCLSAMAYPVVIGVAALALTIGLIEGIMPQIIPLLSGLHTDLPVLTKITILASKTLTQHGLLIAAVIASLIFLFLFMYRRSYGARRKVHILLTRSPVLGSLLTRYSLAVLFRSFGSMTESGLQANDAYPKAVSAIPMINIREKFESKSVRISQGVKWQTIADKSMPLYIKPLITAGENSGTLGICLSRIANMLDDELGHSLKRLTSLLEPVMMTVMGGVVGAIALSIMMPIYDISKALQR